VGEGTVNGALVRQVKISPGWVDHYDRRIEVVFVCTGNICRSPMAEHLLRARLASTAPGVTISSMGLLLDDRAAEPNAIKALQRRGLDLGAHRSRTLVLDELASASLILGMERGHLRAVADRAPELFGRSYTLPEFVRSAAVFGARPAGEGLRTWVERIGVGRHREAYEHDDPITTIADPMGTSRRNFRACADEIDRYLDELVALAWPRPELANPIARPATTGGTP
jgi:protein-tyrosine phosphatase